MSALTPGQRQFQAATAAAAAAASLKGTNASPSPKNQEQGRRPPLWCRALVSFAAAPVNTKAVATANVASATTAMRAESHAQLNTLHAILAALKPPAVSRKRTVHFDAAHNHKVIVFKRQPNAHLKKKRGRGRNELKKPSRELVNLIVPGHIVVLRYSHRLSRSFR